MEIDLDNPDTWPLVTYTCNVQGCENKDIPITMPSPALDTPGICGPCGSPLKPEPVKKSRKRAA